MKISPRNGLAMLALYGLATGIPIAGASAAPAPQPIAPRLLTTTSCAARRTRWRRRSSSFSISAALMRRRRRAIAAPAAR